MDVIILLVLQHRSVVVLNGVGSVEPATTILTEWGIVHIKRIVHIIGSHKWTGNVTGSEMTISGKSRRWRTASRLFGLLLVLWKGKTRSPETTIKSLTDDKGELEKLEKTVVMALYHWRVNYCYRSAINSG